MARSIWGGSVSFGLVNVPIKLYSATTPKSVKFNQLNGTTGNRIKQKRVDAETGNEVAFEDIVKGYEVTPNRYVVVESEELEAVAPKQTKTITLEQFVPQEQIDPLFYDASYYIGPADVSAEKAYRLLAEAMKREGKVGIGKVILRSKEKLVALYVNEDDVLVCSTLVFANEVNNTANIVEFENTAAEVNEAEVKQAAALLEALTDDFDHEAFEDTYRAKVLDLIERKSAGEKIEAPKDETPDAAAPDLMSALEASLAEAESKPKKAKAKPKKRSSRAKAKA